MAERRHAEAAMQSRVATRRGEACLQASGERSPPVCQLTNVVVGPQYVRWMPSGSCPLLLRACRHMQQGQAKRRCC